MLLSHKGADFLKIGNYTTPSLDTKQPLTMRIYSNKMAQPNVFVERIQQHHNHEGIEYLYEKQ